MQATPLMPGFASTSKTLTRLSGTRENVPGGSAPSRHGQSSTSELLLEGLTVCSFSTRVGPVSCTEMRFAEISDGSSHTFSTSVVGLHAIIGGRPQTGLLVVRATSLPW